MSHHLLVPEAAGLIETRAQGTARPRRPKPQAVEALWSRMDAFRCETGAHCARLDPVRLPRRVGSDSHPMALCEVEVWPGGAFRYVWGGPNGGFAAHGRFEEITARRSIHVEIFAPDRTEGEARVITGFRAEGNGCRPEMQVIRSSTAARVGVGATGMAEAMTGAFSRLEALRQMPPCARAGTDGSAASR